MQQTEVHPRTTFDVRQLEPSHLWVLGLANDEYREPARPAPRPPSFWAECECPGDCLRDHENE
jgi:hypothetical protein